MDETCTIHFQGGGQVSVVGGAARIRGLLFQNQSPLWQSLQLDTGGSVEVNGEFVTHITPLAGAD